jgi:hypothetical protein
MEVQELLGLKLRDMDFGVLNLEEQGVMGLRCKMEEGEITRGRRSTVIPELVI